MATSTQWVENFSPGALSPVCPVTRTRPPSRPLTTSPRRPVVWESAWSLTGGGASTRRTVLADVFNLVVRPNPVLAPQEVYETKTARWRQQWPELTVLDWPAVPAPLTGPSS